MFAIYSPLCKRLTHIPSGKSTIWKVAGPILKIAFPTKLSMLRAYEDHSGRAASFIILLRRNLSHHQKCECVAAILGEWPNWQYVAGDFPHGLDFHSNVTERYIRKIKKMGGRVVTVPEKYTAAEL
jgi:hypothetical protein